ncbi:MAG: ATP-binding cassette domain-containing protein [Rhodoferax sp.]|nr:ATP-binding cassette domain-containing protein [Rhodoferax sp.]
MRGLCTRFASKVVHDGVSLDVQRGEIFAIVGGSGSGKSTLLRELIYLQRPDAGSLHVLGTELLQATPQQVQALRQRWGVMFQHGGLFAALTVLENVGLPLREHRLLPSAQVDTVALEKIAQSGLQVEVAKQYPGSLSGGMLKRASLARALALDPELLFLDEPTAGLDPESADGVDQLILQLRQQQGLTVVMVTHDLDLLWHAADRVALLAQGRVQGIGSMQQLATIQQPSVQQFFSGMRARHALAQYANQGGAAWKPR